MRIKGATYRPHILRIVVSALYIAWMTACFTGVESTPKISQKELKKQNVVDTPEKRMLERVTVAKPSKWYNGKKFYIADNRAARAAWSVNPVTASDSLAGAIAYVTRIDTVPSLTDKAEIQVTFNVPDRNVALEYRTGLSPLEWTETTSFSLPHFIDMDFIDTVRQRIVGNSFYILPPRRIGLNGIDTIGTRYQSVHILDVVPATEATPIKVLFIDDEGHLASVLMTVGDATTARRNFDTIFSLSDPRQRYKHIQNDTWELIRHGKVKIGMTPEECRLALGSPDNYRQIPTTAGMVEQWSYMNGMFLLFEDGALSKYRL